MYSPNWQSYKSSITFNTVFLDVQETQTVNSSYAAGSADLIYACSCVDEHGYVDTCDLFIFRMKQFRKKWVCVASKGSPMWGAVILWLGCFTRTLSSWYLCKSARECIYQKNHLRCTESMLTGAQRRSILQIREYCNTSIFFQSMKVRKGLSNRNTVWRQSILIINL